MLKIKIILMLYLYSILSICIGADNITKVSVDEIAEYNSSFLVKTVSWAQIILCVFTLLGVIVAIICHCHAIRKNTKAIKATHDYNKKTITISTIYKVTISVERFDMRRRYPTYYRDETAISARKLKRMGHKERAAIRCYLNRLELLAVGIKKSIYDESTVRDAYKTTMRLSTVVFREYINESQKRSPTLYSALMGLARRWSSEEMQIESNPTERL